MTSSRVALSLLAALALASACGGKSAAPPPTSTATASVEATPGPTGTSTPPPRPTGIPIGTPTPLPIALADNAVWRQVAAMTAGHLAPLLRPPSLPSGLETVMSSYWFEGKPPDPSSFLLEYRGPKTRVRMMAGMLNPAPPPATGHAERVLVRGQQAYLTVEDDSQPSRSSWVSWRESGLWRPEGESSGAPFIDYEVIVEGLSPGELITIVEALRPWAPD